MVNDSTCLRSAYSSSFLTSPIIQLPYPPRPLPASMKEDGRWENQSKSVTQALIPNDEGKLRWRRQEKNEDHNKK